MLDAVSAGAEAGALSVGTGGYRQGAVGLLAGPGPVFILHVTKGIAKQVGAQCGWAAQVFGRFREYRWGVLGTDLTWASTGGGQAVAYRPYQSGGCEGLLKKHGTGLEQPAARNLAVRIPRREEDGDVWC
jgi:hypothetical protein